jgi:hypothetical protein
MHLRRYRTIRQERLERQTPIMNPGLHGRFFTEEKVLQTLTYRVWQLNRGLRSVVGWQYTRAL